MCHNDAKLGESLISFSGWVCDGNFPFCTRSISRKNFSYHCSNRFYFFPPRKKISREAAVLPLPCATQSVHNTFQTLVPASNFACEQTRSSRGAVGTRLHQKWVTLGGLGLCTARGLQGCSGGLCRGEASSRPFPGAGLLPELPAAAAAKPPSDPLQKILGICKGSASEGEAGEDIKTSPVFMRGDNSLLGQ